MAARGKPGQKEQQSSPDPLAPSVNDMASYLTDATQRTFLMLDTLLNRGNNYIEHLDKGTPPLLKFEHEMVLDGHDMPEPCNYALLRLLPPASMPVNLKARPVCGGPTRRAWPGHWRLQV